MFLNFLIPFVLALTSSVQAPPNASAPAAAPTRCYGCCPCDIGHKSW